MFSIALSPKLTDLILLGSISNMQYLEKSGLIKHKKNLASKKSKNVRRCSLLFSVKTLNGDVTNSIIHFSLFFLARAWNVEKFLSGIFSKFFSGNFMLRNSSFLRISKSMFRYCFTDSTLSLCAFELVFDLFALVSEGDVRPNLPMRRPKRLFFFWGRYHAAEILAR